MALKTTYSNANKVESTALCVRYAVQLINDTYYQVTRTATKEYAYTAMTRAAAEQCLQTKIALYTRTYYKLSSTTTSGVPGVASYTDCKATFAKTHGEGDAWNVTISVDEEDVRATATAPTNPAALFNLENLRDYDETSYTHYGIVISNAAYNAAGEYVTVSYTHTIPGVDPDRSAGFILQDKASLADEWVTREFGVVSRVSHVITIRYDIELSSEDVKYIRLQYAGYTSNTYILTVE